MRAGASSLVLYLPKCNIVIPQELSNLGALSLVMLSVLADIDIDYSFWLCISFKIWSRSTTLWSTMVDNSSTTLNIIVPP